MLFRSAAIARTVGVLGYFFAPLPQALVGIAMVVVLFERERRGVQENLLAFSSLEVDASRLLTPPDLVPGLEKLLERLARLMKMERGALVIAAPWRSTLPSVARGFDAGFLAALEAEGLGDLISEVAWRRGGLAFFRDLEEPGPSPQETSGRFQRLRSLLASHGVESVTAASLQTRARCFGVVLFPSPPGGGLSSSDTRLLLGLAMQMGLTLENYVLMHDARRRTNEYEIGRASCRERV